MASETSTSAPSLRRGLSLPLATLYGLGTTIGAGIFALIGKVAGHAGFFAPVSFVVAALLATFTALSFAELCARYPHSAGEAVYVEAGLRSPTLALFTGLFVVAAGCVSAAAILNGAAGYIGELATVPRAMAIVILALSLGLLAAWGIRESVMAASLFTVVEIGGLLVVIAVAAPGLSELPQHLGAIVPPFDIRAWHGILLGSLLAFYAFIGFEDMVNVAEEVKTVRRTLPLAIVLTLVITTVLYLALAAVSVMAVPPQELAASDAPMALIFARSAGASPVAISVISLFALLNGALIQIIMASRVLYGLSTQRWLHPGLARIHPRTQTPLVATALSTAVVLVLALWFPIEPLAQAASLVMLTVFAIVNLALWRMKRRAPTPIGIMVVPRWIPFVGFLISAGFVVLVVAGWTR
jgi:amino acid transporter